MAYVPQTRKAWGRSYATTLAQGIAQAKQRQRLKGGTLSAQEMRAIVEGTLSPYVQAYPAAMSRARSEETESRRLDITEREAKARERAAIAAGVGQMAELGLLGAGLYGYGKGAGWWGVKPTPSPTGAGIAATPTSYGITPPAGYFPSATTGGLAIEAPAGAAGIAAGGAYAPAATSGGLAISAPGATGLAATPTYFYAGPAVAGAVGGQFGERIGEDVGIGRTGGGLLGAAGTGAAIGAAIPGVGPLAGAGIGAATYGATELISSVTGGCIIVTACHGPDSPEVDIARQYRDKYLDDDTLRGYYMLAELIVPFMKN
jgi:hypothetical protein